MVHGERTGARCTGRGGSRASLASAVSRSSAKRSRCASRSTSAPLTPPAAGGAARLGALGGRGQAPQARRHERRHGAPVVGRVAPLSNVMVPQSWKLSADADGDDKTMLPKLPPVPSLMCISSPVPAAARRESASLPPAARMISVWKEGFRHMRRQSHLNERFQTVSLS